MQRIRTFENVSVDLEQVRLVMSKDGGKACRIYLINDDVPAACCAPFKDVQEAWVEYRREKDETARKAESFNRQPYQTRSEP